MTQQPGPAGGRRQPLWITIVVLVVAAAGAWLRQSSGGGAVAPQHGPTATVAETPTPSADAASDDSLPRAIRSESAEANVIGSGRLMKMLPDDTEGLRHQRLLIAVAGGGTILMAHNIDLAPRIVAREGDTIDFKGIYVWNDRGGVVHWTHRDPSGRHPAGWVKVNGAVFQ